MPAATTATTVRSAWGEEFVYGELYLTEEFARIFFRAATDTDTFLGGQAVVVNGDQKLRVALHTDDGELA